MLNIKNLSKTIFIALSLALASGCTTFQAYRVPIQQGNVITKQEVAKLKVGMHKKSVRKILGAPVLDCPFASNNWTYVYTMKIGGKKLVQKELHLTFKHNRLVTMSDMF